MIFDRCKHERGLTDDEALSAVGCNVSFQLEVASEQQSIVTVDFDTASQMGESNSGRSNCRFCHGS